MFTVVITEKGGAQRRLQFEKPEVTIGRVQGNDIILPKGNVSKRHSRIVLKDSRFIVVDLKSTNGTYVNGRKITSPLVVKEGDKIYIGDFILTLEDTGQAAVGEAPPMGSQPAVPSEPPTRDAAQRGVPAMRSSSSQAGMIAARPVSQAQAQPASSPIRAQFEMPPAQGGPPHLPSRDAGSSPARRPASGPPPALHERFPLDEEPPSDIPAMPASRAPSGPMHHQAAQPVGMPMQSHSQSAPQHIQQAQHAAQPLSFPAARPTSRPEVPPPYRPTGPATDLETGLRAVMYRLSQMFDVGSVDPAAMQDGGRWQQLRNAVEGAIGLLQSEGALDPSVDRDQLIEAATREAGGHGALEPLLSDESVREIVVEGADRIVADFGRGLEPVPGTFSSDHGLLTVARRLLAQAGEHLDPTRPVHEARLPDGTHVLVLQRAVAVRGPILVVRRPQQTPIAADDLVSRGVLSREMLDLLRRAVGSRRNIVVCGTPGSGVTTVLGALAGLAGDKERLVTVEDVPDLAIKHENVIALSAGGARALVTMRDVLKQATLLRADRLVVDDVKGSETYDVLVAMASRRDGTLVGVHADHTEDALRQMLLLARLDKNAAPDALPGLLASAVHLVVQVELTGEDRRVTRISEIVGPPPEDGTVPETQLLFEYDGGFQATGNKPRFTNAA